MKRLLLIAIGVALMGAGPTCEPQSNRDLAARHLGPGSVCTWRTSDAQNEEIVCISSGRRYTCLVGDDRKVACAITSDVSPEAR